MIIIQDDPNADMRRYLNELDEKVKRAKEAAAGSSKIGIFWLHVKDGKIQIFHAEPSSLDFGQEYGNFIVDPREHYKSWEVLKRLNAAPKNSEYVDLPRGRVAYDKLKRQFVVFHGNYIKSSPDVKRVIINEFRLKSNTRWEPDLHYHKFKRWGF